MSCYLLPIQLTCHCLISACQSFIGFNLFRLLLLVLLLYLNFRLFIPQFFGSYETYVAHITYKSSLWRPSPISSLYLFWLSYMYIHTHALYTHIFDHNVTYFMLWLSSNHFSYLLNDLFNHLFTYYLNFSFWPTNMCPVTDEIVQYHLACYTGDVCMYIY